MDIIVQEEVRNAARVLGRMRSEKKARTSRENGKLGGRGKKRAKNVDALKVSSFIDEDEV